jgi:nucleoside 2-deoxyribosyltransferase
MKVFIAIKYHPDNRHKPFIERISAALEKSGLETFCVVRDIEKWGQVEFDPAELMRQSFAAIDASDVIVIELTEKGVGLGIEAGYAYAKGIPIVTIAQKGSDISTTLQGISQKIFLYSEIDELSHLL